MALPQETAAPYLWKVTSPGGTATSWIFGTIHLPRPDVTRIPPVVRDAIDHSDAVYTEIPADIPTMLRVVPMMMLPNERTVDTVLGPELTASLESEIKAIQPELTLKPFSRFKPWALVATILQLEDQLKYPGAVALDTLIYQRAASADKEVGGIETPEEQIGIFDEFTDAEQVLMVKDTLKQLDAIRKENRAVTDFLAELYLAGDLDKLVAEIMKLDSIGDNPALSAKFLDRLLYRRNTLMAERIAKRLREHPKTKFFFAIGAGHLHGNRGVIADLKKAGFTLTRVQ
jgi:uncharacterized protein